jgi:glycosyltransferase involved in cell wall biosynthesis
MRADLDTSDEASLRGTSPPSGNRPVVSTIVPTTGDRAPRLQSALASIWAQEGLGEQFDVEVIVVDDASWGPTEEVVRRFPETRYVRFETNRGEAAARNAGLEAATGKYVAFLDDDDLWSPRRLSVQVPVLEQAPGPEVAYSQFVHVHNDRTSNVVPSDGPSGWIFEAIVKTWLVHVPAVLIPGEAFDTVGGFDETLRRGTDTDMWMRLALQFPFRYVPGTVAVFVESRKERTETSIDGKTHWVITRDKVLTLIQAAPNRAELRPTVLVGTGAHIVLSSLAASKLDQARRTLLQLLEEVPVLESDRWHRSRMTELMLAVAFASGSTTETKSLFADFKRAGGRKDLRHRLKMRAFLADLWTEVALHQASGRHRDDRRARSAAASAILQNPLKPLSRPGLLRLVARAISHIGRDLTLEPAVPSRNTQAAPSEAHTASELGPG